MTKVVKWEKLPAQRARAGHTATLIGGGKILVFGGRCGESFLDDLWEFDLQREKWRQLQEHAPLAARAYHSATLVGENQLWIVGGSDAKTILDDVHVLNTDTLEWSNPVLKSKVTPRGTHAALLHPLHPKSILVYGGYGGFKPGSFTWLGDLSLLNTVGYSPSGRNQSFPKRISQLYCLRAQCFAVWREEQRWHSRRKRFNICAAGVYKWQKYDSKVVDGKSRALRIADLLDGPDGRAAHTVVVFNNALYLYGGYGGKGATLSDTYVMRRLPQRGRQTSTTKATSRKVSFVSLPLEGGEDNEGWLSTRKQAVSASHAAAAAAANAEANDDPYHWTPEATGDRTVLLGDASVKACSSAKRKSPPISTEIEKELQEMRKKRLALESEAAAARSGMAKASTEREIVQAENESLQRKVDDLQERVNAESIRAGSLQRELDERVITSQRTDVLSARLKQELQASGMKLDAKERENQELLYQLRSVEKKLDERERSLERIKEINDDAILERDEYKSCVQKLEDELQKQMQALQQAKANYDAERGFLLQEVAERKGTADRIFTELGVSRESCRVMQENVTLLTKQLDQANEKLERHYREKEELSRSNGALSAELRQVKSSRDSAESSLQLLRNELDSARTVMEKNALDANKMKDDADEAAKHITTLHSSLRKAQDEIKTKTADNDRLRNHLHELEEFEVSHVQVLQRHIERIQCIRQSCPRT